MVQMAHIQEMLGLVRLGFRLNSTFLSISWDILLWNKKSMFCYGTDN